MKLLDENYDRKKHQFLVYGKDAFGNVVEPEPGFRLLNQDEGIKKGDRCFDIYSGWLKGVEGWYAKNDRDAYYYGGRWTVWERKVA